MHMGRHSCFQKHEHRLINVTSNTKLKEQKKKKRFPANFPTTCTIFTMSFHDIHSFEMPVAFWTQESNPKVVDPVFFLLNKGNDKILMIG